MFAQDGGAEGMLPGADMILADHGGRVTRLLETFDEHGAEGESGAVKIDVVIDAEAVGVLGGEDAGAGGGAEVAGGEGLSEDGALLGQG